MLKIAFLFLTITNVYHEQHWKDFFRGHEDSYSIYLHAKETVAPDSWFKRYELLTKVPTTWANTMKAQIALLKQALTDPDNEKFIFASESTIPLQTFDTAYATVMSSPESMFYFRPNPHVNRAGDFMPNAHRNLDPIPKNRQFKNTQWVILNREHAQMMVNDTQWIEIITSYPHDQEHYPSTFLLNNGCFDDIIPCDTTYVEWRKGPKAPYVFTDFGKSDELQMIKNAIAHGYLFARKVDKKCVMASLDSVLAYRIPHAATVKSEQKVEKAQNDAIFVPMHQALKLTQ